MIRVLLALAVLALASGASCYDPNKPPPCQPGSVDWPRCDDPTQPKAAVDGGAGR